MEKHSKKKQPKKGHEEKQENMSSTNKDKLLIIGIIGIVIIFGSIVAWMKLSPKEENLKPVDVKNFKGFVFERYADSKFWETKLTVNNRNTGKTESYKILFHYAPDEVNHIFSVEDEENISITPYIFYNTKTIYITTEPDYPAAVVLSGVEIAKILAIIAKTYTRQIIIDPATTKPVNNSIYPVITCNDLNVTTKVVYLKLGNSTGIYNKKGCVVVQGTDATQLLKASEKLAFELLGIL